MKAISKLHYITDTPELAEQACRFGVRWIQMRIKSDDTSFLLGQAKEFESICQNYGAQLILNDHVWLFDKVQAAGVHVGKEDSSPERVRSLIGEDAIIGLTTNNLEDVLKAHNMPVDYLGLGPYRFTETKKKLSPILGLKGYQEILQNAKEQENGSLLPIIAIGGILAKDVLALRTAGCHGVAVSGVISNAKEKEKTVTEFLNAL